MIYKRIKTKLGLGKPPVVPTPTAEAPAEAPAPRRYESIEDIIEHTKTSEFSKEFFSPGALRFFKARVSKELFGTLGNVFVTSERMEMPYYDPEPRKFTVRYIDPFSGNIGDLSKFQEFETRYKAFKFAESAAKEQDVALGVAK